MENMMDLQHSFRRSRLTVYSNLCHFRSQFRLHSQRNSVLLLLTTLLVLRLVAFRGQGNSTEERWSRLQSFAHPGILGAPPDIQLNSPQDVRVQLCHTEGKPCSTWNGDTVWSLAALRKDETWLSPGRIQVPIGVQAVVTLKDRSRRTLRYGTHECGEGLTTLPCHDIISLRVEESILSTIDKFVETCSSNDWEHQPGLVHTIRPKKTPTKRDVTMIAQFSISRLVRFEAAMRAWNGPVSAVIFLASNSDVFELQKYFERPGKLELYESAALTIVKPEYTSGVHNRYPINHLRNIGILTAMTDYIYVIDADFVPTTRLYQFARTTVISLIETASTPTAYVVPCLAIKEEYQGLYPDTIQELQPMIRSHAAYITDPRAGHGPTATSIFLNPPIYGGSPAFEVCYESQWEPYYIVNRNAPHPYYDERFKNQGGDKQSHALLMNALGYRFMVLREHFMYHMDHPRLKWTGDGLDKERQRDFTYFEDYSPVLYRIFGMNYRWPRGCSRPLVSSSKRDLQGIGTI